MEQLRFTNSHRYQKNKNKNIGTDLVNEIQMEKISNTFSAMDAESSVSQFRIEYTIIII